MRHKDVGGIHMGYSNSGKPLKAQQCLQSGSSGGIFAQQNRPSLLFAKTRFDL